MEILIVLGYITIIIGNLMVIVAAFKESVLWGLGVFFIPLVGLFFVITPWQEAKTGFLTAMAGLGLLVLGLVFRFGFGLF